MARYITLNLVNDQGNPLPWPGTPTQFELGTQEEVTPVWIGVSQDGSDNQIYPITASAQTILNSWPRLYQGVQVSLVAGPDESPLEPGPNEYVYYNSLDEFNRLVAACCVATSDQESPGGGESPAPEMLTMLYIFTDNTGGNGNLVITADGDEVLNVTGGSQGTFEAPVGSDLVITASGGWDHSVRQYEDGNEIDQTSDSSGNPAIMNVNDVNTAYAVLAESSPMPPE